jgi:3-oxoacyl-[acyl-carrier-protein] synthase II
MKRVVVTGLGAITPLGNTVEQFWQQILAGKSGIGPITKFDASKFKTRFAGEVKDFNPEEYLEKKEIKKYDLFTQYAIGSSDQAIKDAGLDFTAIADDQLAEMVESVLLKRNWKNFMQVTEHQGLILISFQK